MTLNTGLIEVEMIKRGLNQTTLAQAIGVTTATVHTIMRKKTNPSVATVVKIAQHLKLNLNDIAPDHVKKYGLPPSIPN